MAEISKVLQIGDNIRPESLMKNLYKIDSPYDLTDDIVTQSLNLLQSSIKDGVLEPSRTVTNFNKTSDQIIELLKSKNVKNFTTIRQIVADSNIRDYNELYRVLFERADEFTDSAIATLIIADYQYKSLMAPDKEITMMACISKLLTNK